MKVKRKVAALLALAMVVTGQPSWVLADGLENLGGMTVVESEDIATPLVPEKETDDLEKESTPNDADEVTTAQVDYVILPEEAADDHGATIIGPTTVESDETLEFKVKVRDAYELSYVDVAGAEAEPVSVEDNVYHYEESDIYQDTTVTVYLEKKPEFEETVETNDGLVFEISADAGVLPAGTMVKVNPLAADYADQVKEEVLAEAKVEEEALVETLTEEEAGPLYAAYQIEFVNEEEETLSNSDIGGKVEVSVAMMADEEAELAVYKVDTVDETEVNETDTEELSDTENDSNDESVATYTFAEESIPQKRMVRSRIALSNMSHGTTKTDEATLEVALLAVPAVRASKTVTVSLMVPYNLESEKWFTDDHKWTVIDAEDNPIDQPEWVTISNMDSEPVKILVNSIDGLGNTFLLRHDYRYRDSLFGEKKSKTDTYQINVSETTKKSPVYVYVKKAEFANGGNAGSTDENYEYWGEGTMPLDSAQNMIASGALEADPVKYELADFDWAKLVEIPDKPNGKPNAVYKAPNWSTERKVTDGYGYPILYLEKPNGSSPYTAYYYEDSPEAIDFVYSKEWTGFFIS